MLNKFKPDPSIYHIFSLGYVVETNHKDCYCSPIIKVLPIEYITTEDKNSMLYKLRQEVNVFNLKDKDIDNFNNGEKIKVKIKKVIESTDGWKNIDKSITINRDRYMFAVWVSDNHNEFNPPCINKGDLVLIYTYGDTNQYYWNTVFRRTILEHKIGEGSIKHFVEAKDNKINKEVLYSTCTNDISFKIHCEDYLTNIRNYLELSNGEFSYLDQNGNLLNITQENDITMRALNNIGIYGDNDIYLKSTNLNIFVEENIFLTSKNLNINNEKTIISSKDSLTIKINKSKINIKNNVNIEASGNTFIKGKTVLISGENTSMISKGNKLVLTGDIVIKGNLEVGGNLNIVGNLSPNSCSCNSLCSGSNSSTSVDNVNNDEKPNKIKQDTITNDRYEEVNNVYEDKDGKRKTFIKKIKEHIEGVIGSIIEKVGVGN